MNTYVLLILFVLVERKQLFVTHIYDVAVTAKNSTRYKAINRHDV